MTVTKTFANDRNLQLLADNDTIYTDGTFYTCQSLFTQLYTLHGMVDEEMFPLVFALLPGKSEQLCTRYFHLLKEACTQRQIALQPTTFFIDYETAVQNAARTSFPGITIKGCFFYYTQCIWRKVQNTGMQTHYSDDPIIHPLVRLCCSITFSTTGRYCRRMVQRIRRPRALKPNYWPNIIHRLRNNLLGRDTQAFMEPLPNPRTKNNKSYRGLAQQDKEVD